MRRRLSALAPAFAILALTAAPVVAGVQDRASANLRAQGEAYSRAPDSEQNPAEVSETQRLNAEIAARNAAAEQTEMDDAARADAASAAGEVMDARYQAEMAAYEQELARYERERAEYDRAMQVYEGLIAACERSGRADCRAPVSSAPPVG